MASDFLKPVANQHETCKVCGGTADLYGVVDFYKNCEEQRRRVLPLSGIPLYYHRCPACDFVFTTAFDSFTNEEFARHIYNDQYHLVDPDFAISRPQNNAKWLDSLFARQRPARTLDYGGGNGSMAELLRKSGFPDVQTYDPFVPEHAQRPQGKFELITSFEVLEHSPTPKQTIADMISLLADPGLIVFSTLLRAGQSADAGVNWWYVGPRNGHVSIYSPNALQRLWGEKRMSTGSFNANLHVAFGRMPPFASHITQAPVPAR